MVGTAWLQAYLNMVRNQGKAAELIPEREAFRFGASRVYESTYSTIIVFHLGKSWVAVKASVIHGDIPPTALEALPRQARNDPRPGEERC